MKTQNNRCWACGNLEVICWGKQVEKQRFKCKTCGIFFIRNSKEQTLRNRFVWFEKWVIERQICNTLGRESGLSKDTLQRIFYEYISRSPSVKII